MNHYLKWRDGELVNLKQVTGCCILWTELDEDGRVLREIGVNEDGKCEHKVDLSEKPHDALFDGAVIEVDRFTPDNVSGEEFHRLWQRLDAANKTE